MHYIHHNIFSIIFSGCANFLNPNLETTELLKKLIQKENEYVTKTGESDAVFGVYQKK